MITPTTQELGEYKILWDEFKSFQIENPKTHVDTEVIKKIITPLSKDDPMFVHGERLVRYNRFLMMSTKFAAFFFDKGYAHAALATA